MKISLKVIFDKENVLRKIRKTYLFKKRILTVFEAKLISKTPKNICFKSCFALHKKIRKCFFFSQKKVHLQYLKQNDMSKRKQNLSRGVHFPQKTNAQKGHFSIFKSRQNKQIKTNLDVK